MTTSRFKPGDWVQIKSLPGVKCQVRVRSTRPELFDTPDGIVWLVSIPSLETRIWTYERNLLPAEEPQ